MPKLFPGPISAEAQARFWQRVWIRGPDDCWLWLGACHVKNHRKTYGYCHPYGAKGGHFRAHRVAYFIVKGEDLGDASGLHSCDDMLCCNPAHLSPGTQTENLADMRAKGREGDCRIFGEDHGRCVISDEQVAQMRRLHASGGCWSERSLAEHFGIGRSQAHRILSGQSRQYRTEEAPRRPVRVLRG